MNNSNPSFIKPEDFPFYVGSVVLIAWAVMGLFLQPELMGASSPWTSSFVMVVAVILACVPSFQKRRYETLGVLGATMRDANKAIGDLDRVKEEHGSVKKSIQYAAADLAGSTKQLEENLDRFEKIALAQKRLEEEIINSRQAAGQAAKQVEAWEQAAIEYLQVLERILSFPDIDDSLRKTTEKQVKDFVGLTGNLGFHLIRPEMDSILNENECIVDDVEPSSEVEADRVIRCTSWGFRLSSRPPIKAKVILASTEKPVADTARTKRPAKASKGTQPLKVVKEDAQPSKSSDAADASDKNSSTMKGPQA